MDFEHTTFCDNIKALLFLLIMINNHFRLKHSVLQNLVLSEKDER